MSIQIDRQRTGAKALRRRETSLTLHVHKTQFLSTPFPCSDVPIVKEQKQRYLASFEIEGERSLTLYSAEKIFARTTADVNAAFKCTVGLGLHVNRVADTGHHKRALEQREKH